MIISNFNKLRSIVFEILVFEIFDNFQLFLTDPCNSIIGDSMMTQYGAVNIIFFMSLMDWNDKVHFGKTQFLYFVCRWQQPRFTTRPSHVCVTTQQNTTVTPVVTHCAPNARPYT